jgi:hypothetical protein
MDSWDEKRKWIARKRQGMDNREETRPKEAWMG